MANMIPNIVSPWRVVNSDCAFGGTVFLIWPAFRRLIARLLLPENYSLEGLLRRELTFTPMPKENVLRTLYTLRLYPALKSSERVRL